MPMKTAFILKIEESLTLGLSKLSLSGDSISLPEHKDKTSKEIIHEI